MREHGKHPTQEDAETPALQNRPVYRTSTLKWVDDIRGSKKQKNGESTMISKFTKLWNIKEDRDAESEFKQTVTISVGDFDKKNKREMQNYNSSQGLNRLEKDTMKEIEEKRERQRRAKQAMKKKNKRRSNSKQSCYSKFRSGSTHEMMEPRRHDNLDERRRVTEIMSSDSFNHDSCGNSHSFVSPKYLKLELLNRNY